MKLLNIAIIFSLLFSLSCKQDSLKTAKLSNNITDVEMGSQIFLHKDGKVLFPIGLYELPEDNAKLQRYAQSGINLFRCSGNADLDRVAAVDAMGWVSLNLQEQDTLKVIEKIKSVTNHQALAIWEGPDEIIHSFTRWSGLYRITGVHKEADEWKRQTPNALEYSERKGNEILQAIDKNIKQIRKLDNVNRPIWMNEAHDADLKFVREYTDAVDIIGVDVYPVREKSSDIARIGDITRRWGKIGRNKKEVFMVLQAFSWDELGDYFGAKKVVYPSFNESRFMAYDAIVNGAGGILYWGSHYIKNELFLESILSLTSELDKLQPFLVEVDQTVKVDLIERVHKVDDRGVRVTVKRHGDDWIIILVNEDNRPHFGVEVSGLEALNGSNMKLLYGTEEYTLKHGEFITRLLPLQVKVFASDLKWQSQHFEGRDFQ